MMNQKHRRALGEVIVNQLGPAGTAKPVDVKPDIHSIKPKDGIKPTVHLIKPELIVKPDIHSVKREIGVSNPQAQAPRKGAMKKGPGMDKLKKTHVPKTRISTTEESKWKQQRKEEMRLSESSPKRAFHSPLVSLSTQDLLVQRLDHEAMAFH
jgi:hypothetical protein